MYQTGLKRRTECELGDLRKHYGQDNGGLYLVITKMTSLSEDDQGMGDFKKFRLMYWARKE